MVMRDSENEITIVLPQMSDDALSQSLRVLTQVISNRNPELDPGFGLGGPDGYGHNVDCDLFMMHRYCWCEKSDCEWCAGCTCDQGLWSYWLDGREVLFDEQEAFQCEWYYGPGGFKAWLDRGGEVATPRGTPEYDVQAARTETRKDPDRSKWCRVCRGEFGNAPNFHHKPTGLRVWWYKWIGRDAVVKGPSGIDPAAVVYECTTYVRDGGALG